VKWREKQSALSDVTAVTQLREKLEEAGFSTKHWDWWLGWKSVGDEVPEYKVGSREFTVRVPDPDDGLVKEIVDVVVRTLFDEYRDLVSAANAALERPA
jgi:hypothetical protein